MTLDFGETLPLERIEILWEFVAKSFAISTSSDGLSWAEVYATDLNGLKKTAVNLGHQSARKLRLTMREVHAPHSSCVCVCIAERRCFFAGSSVAGHVSWARRVWSEVFESIRRSFGHYSRRLWIQRIEL